MSKKVLTIELVEKNKFSTREEIEGDILIPEYILVGNAIFLYETDDERNKILKCAKGLGTNIIEQGDTIYVFGMKEQYEMHLKKIKEFLREFKFTLSPAPIDLSKAVTKSYDNIKLEDELNQDKETIINSLMDKFGNNGKD